MAGNTIVLHFSIFWTLMAQSIKPIVQIYLNRMVWLNAKNRHLLEVVRASLSDAHMPLCYWGEALLFTTYLINRVPSRSINFKTPYQALTKAGVAPSIPNLPPHIFGYVAYVHLVRHQHSKLMSQAVRCVFVGYAIHQKGYRSYHPPTKHMYITMDVVFHEDTMYFSKSNFHREILRKFILSTTVRKTLWTYMIKT